MIDMKIEISEQFEEVLFLPEQDNKLIGYAERFGNDCLLLYNDINFIRYNSPSDCLEKIRFYSPNSRVMDGYDSCLIGHFKLDDDSIILVYDREAVIEQLKQEYMSDKSGIFNGEEECEEGALEWYSYNMIGSYMDGVPAFAVVYAL